MQFQVKNKDGAIRRRDLQLVKTSRSRYVVRVDGDREIGTVWKAFGRVKKFRNHLLDGTHEVERWFAATAAGEKLGRESPCDEGFSTRLEALIELIEITLKITRE